MPMSEANALQLFQLMRNCLYPTALYDFMAALGYECVERFWDFFDDHPHTISSFFFANLAWDLRVPPERHAEFLALLVSGFKTLREEGFFVTDCHTLRDKLNLPFDRWDDHLHVAKGFEDLMPRLWHIQRENRRLFSDNPSLFLRPRRRPYRQSPCSTD